jgi:hypothetical protein
MNRRQKLVGVAITMLVSTTVVGFAGPASAKVKHHHQGGKGGPSAPMTIQIDPNPLIEAANSEVAAVLQVETSPSYAGDAVELSTPQLTSSCGGLALFQSLQAAAHQNEIIVTLDNEGNATLLVFGTDCAPGNDLIEADLAVAPYYTATADLVVEPPTVTSQGVVGFPSGSGTVSGGEVETGDVGRAQSTVYAVFYVETDPVYAEQPVEISSPELQDRCGVFSQFASLAGNGQTDEAILDDDGNAVFYFQGVSCAAGSSVVTADVLAGTHPTYTTTFNILPPQPTI